MSKTSKKETSSLPDVEPTNRDAAIAELTRRGYDAGYALNYAKAARSWTPKDSPAWKVWKQVEDKLSPPEEK